MREALAELASAAKVYLRPADQSADAVRLTLALKNAKELINPTYTLTRLNYTKTYTAGEFVVEGRTFYTVECPWLDNSAFISCIPEGTYTCRRYASKRHGACWLVEGTAPRTGILFHAANTANDVEGCIGLGLTKFDDHSVRNSKMAIKYFNELTTNIEYFNLVISSFKKDIKDDSHET